MKCWRCQHDNPPEAASCDRCSVSLPVSVDAERVRAQLKRWQERLLDLTRGNPLLGINRSRVSKLRIAEPSAQALFRDFVVEEEAKLKMPRVVKVHRHPNSGPVEEPSPDADYHVEPGDVILDARPIDLLRRLRRIHDNARTTVEERGVTTLQLSFGVLKWEDPLLGQSTSPLWLVPCQLESFGPNAPMRLARADEEMQLNPALELYLRERHRVQLSSVPEEPQADNLASFLEGVRVAVRDHGWKVEEEIWLSTYSFESLAIYQDLRALTDVALANPVVVALARATAPPEGSESLGEEALDTMPTPGQVPAPVLPTDSSQLKALTLTRAGRHLVVHGPPGTGKSQTITNLIADALAQNKKILFVSAKMAALNVVHDRLTRLGLGRFCLEAHSTKAGKLKIVEELKRTLEAAQDAKGDLLDDELDDLLRLREQLNAYVNELHTRKAPLDLTIYQALGKVEKLSKESDLRGTLPWTDPMTVARAELNAALEALGELGAQAEVFDHQASHPWRGFAIERGRPLRREAIENDLSTIREALQALHTNITQLAATCGVAAEALAFDAVENLVPALSELVTLDRLPAAWSTRGLTELRSTAALMQTAAANARELSSGHAEYQRALKVPPRYGVELLAPLERDFRAWTRVVRPSYWRWRASVRQSLQERVAADLSSLRSYLALARRVFELEQWFETRRDALTHEVDASEILQAHKLAAAGNRLRVAVQLRTALAATGLKLSAPSRPLTDEVRRDAKAIASVAQDATVKEAIRRVDLAWPAGFADGVAVARAPLTGVLARCAEILAVLPRMHEWVALQHTLLKCQDLGLAKFVEALGSLSARRARGAFERRFYTAWATAVLDSSPLLAVFSGAQRENQIERFRALDAKIRQSALVRVKVTASGPARRVAAAQTGVGTASEVGVLRRELEKRRRIKPLRKLFAEIPNVLQALKPCLLMSPLSVSTFLKPEAMSFDLVVFDEASQLPIQEAVPAILRADQVVVAGDKNQLPPTSFFDASIIFDDDEGEESDRQEDLEPLESLLDESVASYPVFDQAHLRWHYRSRDERLINFSNRYFYHDKPLITFPSAHLSEDQGIRLAYVPDGVWDRGASRTNRAEARTVARLTVEQVDRHPERSLGVVAMNVTQREAIEEALDELLLQRPDLAPLLDRRRSEPFFIKALENVQGDERDTMIMSVGYGKRPNGALSFNFGPLNQEGGWRRLNVLVTRARWQTILVTSMRSQELSGVNPNNRGAVALRNFIDYTERKGELPADLAVVIEAETNDFEDAVAEALRERGLQVDQQVGASAYRIDLAIRDPRDARRYILGVECDGATYHSAKTARDRDLLRQQILREQGWRLYRVWSTDWFRDREKAIASVLRANEQALQAPAEESVPAPPPVPHSEDAAKSNNPRPSDSGSVTAVPPASVARRYTPGTPYKKYRELGNRDLLLDRRRRAELAGQIKKIVEFEGPIHRELLIDRVKQVNGVGRVGPKVEANVDRAMESGVRSGLLVGKHGDFFSIVGSSLATFRTPGDGVERPLAMIPPQEIELAILYIVEDQFGYQRQALPRAVGDLFEFERTTQGFVETVGNVVDDLVQRGLLSQTGPNVYLA